MSSKPFLYTRGRHGLCRIPIQKETEKSYLVGQNEDTKFCTRVPKNTMRVSGDWHSTHFYFQTPELDAEYAKLCLVQKFRRTSQDHFHKIDDIEIITKMLALFDEWATTKGFKQ